MTERIPAIRTGIGYDIHRLVAGRDLILGGVRFDSPVGLDGHSDADVLSHAIADAVLGAIALGDIGQHFPPGDPRWAGADSIELLRAAVKLAHDRGWTVGNVDATVIAEAPKVNPGADVMRARLADALHVSVDDVSLKATTNELLGAIGRGEGIAALAIATMIRHDEAVS